jgi:2,4-dienoyl-CoA reductase-like NADH-dependent reductase (Old Yellow Enzyme family)
MRYPLEVAAAIREVRPRHKALGMRITGTGWADGGITSDEAGIFAGKLRDIGFDYVCVSSRGVSPAARSAVAPGYQVPLAAAVKKASGITVQAVGMIVDPHQAEAIVADGHADASRWRARFSTTRAGFGMPPPRSVPMPSTRHNTCAPSPNIGRALR